MITSLYPHNCVPGHEYQLPVDKLTIADVFNANGYHTAYVGKWHLDGFHERDGRAAKHIIPKDRRGRFNYWVGYENNNSQYDCYVHGNNAETEIPLTKLNKYETDALTDLFIQHIDTLPDDKPFFGVLSVQPPHDPYVAPPENMKNFTPQSITLRKNVPDVDWVEKRAGRELSGAYAMIENLDYNVGRLVKWLKDTGKYENTHIIFFSDHGDMHGSHGLFRKMNPYEESIKIPFIISGCQSHYEGWKNGIAANPLNHVDIAPTTLGLCGIDVPDCMQGTDYSALRINSNKNTAANYPDSAYLQSVIPTKHGDSTEFPWRGILTDDGYKYVSFENMPWLMFNLNNDPYEQVNLAYNPSFGRKRNELQSRLQKWIDDTEDDFKIKL